MDLKLTRRQFLKGAAAAGVAMSLPLKFGVKEAYAFYQSPGLEKFILPLHGVQQSRRRRFRWRFQMWPRRP